MAQRYRTPALEEAISGLAAEMRACVVEELERRIPHFSLRPLHPLRPFRQQALPQVRSTEPKWIPSKAKCLKAFERCSKQLNKFLLELLPMATDFSEQISGSVPESKIKEITSVFNYLAFTSLSEIFVKEEIEKQLKEIRKPLIKQFHDKLKIFDGCLFTKFGKMIPCRYNPTIKKYIPILTEGGDCRNRNNSQWSIPDGLKMHSFIIVGYFNHKKLSIQKIDPVTHQTTQLYTGYALRKRMN